MNDNPTRQDIINCYRLALGRDPEAEAVIEEKLSQRRSTLLTDFFSSGEFNAGIRRSMTEESTGPTVPRTPPGEEIKEWAATFIPLSQPAAERVRGARGWAELYHALFSDDEFTARVLTDALRATNTEFVETLAERQAIEAANSIEGRIELVTPHELRGWAVDRAEPERRLCLELWVGGAFRAAVVPDRYRPELQHRFGGGGMFGFAMSRPFEPCGAGPATAELREARSGAIVQVVQLAAVAGPPIDVAAALRRELGEVRAMLSNIERRLPDLHEAYSFGLDLYDDYFRTYYAPRQADAPSSMPLPSLAVLVDARAGTSATLDGTLDSLARQHGAPAQIVVMHQGGSAAVEIRTLVARWQARLGDGSTLIGIASDADWSGSMQAMTVAATTPHLILVDAHTRLAPHACEQIDTALAAGALLVFGDSDTIDLDPAGLIERYRDPAFRSAFDAELFMQQGDLGPVLGLSRRLVESATEYAGGNIGTFYEFVLRALRFRNNATDFLHLPTVLAHTTADPKPVDLDARRDALNAHLRDAGVEVQAEQYVDVIGATPRSLVRIRRRPPADTRAAVIIPTRDRLDLLEPCLNSLIATADQNRTAFEILVVDNQSREPETRAFLARLEQSQRLRVLAHDGPFNWALINNRAALQTDADVLIFLNNDTAALTRDWCDELCSQAMRPDVGAVGARLLYGDGTIQHAGVVLGGLHAFAAHEGVGVPGDNPGYLNRHILLREVLATTGACLAVRRSIFAELGGFDALNLPIEGNDIDFCLRARSAGFKNLYDPYCTFYHYESKSRGQNVNPQRWQQAEAAGAFMRARWGEAFEEDPFYNSHFDRAATPLSRLRPLTRAG